MRATGTVRDTSDDLLKVGLIETMSRPHDGVNRNTHINWGDIQALAVEAQLDNLGGEEMLSTAVTFTYQRSGTGERATARFAVDKESIATTSGAHSAGRALLTAEQSAVLSPLIDAAVKQARDALAKSATPGLGAER